MLTSPRIAPYLQSTTAMEVCTELSKEITCHKILGCEVSQYAADNLPPILLKNENFKKGEIEAALTECFIEFDKCLLTEDVKEILKGLKEQNEGKPKPVRVRKENDEEEVGEGLCLS